MLESQSQKKKKNQITFGILLGVVFLGAIILWATGCFDSKSKSDKTGLLVSDDVDCQAAIVESAANFDSLRYDFSNSLANFRFFTLESFKEAYMGNPPDTYHMIPVLACHQHCNHIFNTNFDNRTQKISEKAHLFLTNVYNASDPSAAARIFYQIYYHFLENFDTVGKDKWPDIVCFYDYLMRQLQNEEKLVSQHIQYFFEDAILTNRNASDALASRIHIFNVVNIRATSTPQPIAVLFGEQRAEIEISKGERIHKKDLLAAYSKYLLINITGLFFDEDNNNIGKKTLLSEKVMISDKTYCPKLVICYPGQNSDESGDIFAEYILFTSDSCLNFHNGSIDKITTEKAFEMAFDRAMAVIYERMD